MKVSNSQGLFCEEFITFASFLFARIWSYGYILLQGRQRNVVFFSGMPRYMFSKKVIFLL